MTHLSTMSPEEMRIEVRKKSKDLTKVLAPYREFSIAGRVRTQLRRGYVTNEMLDELVAYYPEDETMMAAVQRCRDALTRWHGSSKYTHLIQSKLKGWII